MLDAEVLTYQRVEDVQMSPETDGIPQSPLPSTEQATHQEFEAIDMEIDFMPQ